MTARDLANNTFVLYGYSNASATVIDNRQIFESASLACNTVNGTLANLTDSSAGFLGALFAYYKTSVLGASTQWGNRRVCAWVGLSNLATIYPTFSSLSNATVPVTSELFWAEDAGAQCGAVSRLTTPYTGTAALMIKLAVLL